MITRLMGLSAFAGLVCLLVGTPLNNYLSHRVRCIRLEVCIRCNLTITLQRVKLQKELLVARDKRVKILNELLNGVSCPTGHYVSEVIIDSILSSLSSSNFMLGKIDGFLVFSKPERMNFGRLPRVTILYLFVSFPHID